MGQYESRRAKVTPETLEEARKLRELWDTRSHPSQAVFGEMYGIGNQSAVSQFLRGQAPLSLKAANGFAQGLDCRIEDFSPRLAAEASSIAGMVAGGDAQVADVASQIAALPVKQRDWVLRTVRDAIEFARETITNGLGNSPAQSEENQPPIRLRRR